MYQAHPDRGRKAFAPDAREPRSEGGAADPEALAEGDGDAAGPVCLRVLVVDDAPDVTEMLALMITYAGYEVKTAFSAAEALDVARAHRFDAVISDIGMPGMSGYQLAEALRSTPGYESTPLIAVTGFSMYDSRARALDAGFDDFLNKPINPSALIDAVRRLCG
jgi:CheY-like chemotaxis protein